jgi:hypothetical protein
MKKSFKNGSLLKIAENEDPRKIYSKIQDLR